LQASGAISRGPGYLKRENPDVVEDPVTARDGLSVGVDAPLEDLLNWRINWQVAKYKDDAAFRAGRPYEVNDVPGNLLTTAGIGVSRPSSRRGPAT
jgi:hypothetical protein